MFANNYLSRWKISRNASAKFELGTARRFSPAKSGLDFAENEFGEKEKASFFSSESEPQRVFEI